MMNRIVAGLSLALCALSFSVASYAQTADTSAKETPTPTPTPEVTKPSETRTFNPFDPPSEGGTGGSDGSGGGAGGTPIKGS